MTLELEAPPGVWLRRSQPGDIEFARDLYLKSSKPLLTVIGCWDEEAVLARFNDAFASRVSSVICTDGANIGFLQVSVGPEVIHLHQMHLIGTFRNRGIGTLLLKSIMNHAQERGIPLTLNVVPGNPVISLYLRLGFQIMGEEKDLIRMRWTPTQPDTG